MKKFLREGILYPETEKNWDDEIHLILEFKKEELWGGVPSPRANRMILTHDVNNIETTGLLLTTKFFLPFPDSKIQR